MKSRLQRNLVYQICGIKTNREWERCILELRTYLKKFDGTKVVVVKVGHGLVPANEIQRMFPSSYSIKWLVLENDTELHEYNGFIQALDLIEDKAKGLTFYAHSKGVSYYGDDPKRSPVRLWRRAMLYYCLEDFERVEVVLEKHPCCGAFKKNGNHHLSVPSNWHFSGTFFWFVNDRLFNRDDWKSLPADRYAVEGYLSQFFTKEEAYCLIGEDPDPDYIYGYTETDWLRLGISKHILDELTKASTQGGRTKLST